MNTVFCISSILYCSFLLSASDEIPCEHKCSEGALLEETFKTGDHPYELEISRSPYYISTPWGYDRSEDVGRLYPIVVNGCWGEGWAFTDDIRQRYPAFYLEYQRCDYEADGEELSDLLDVALKQGLRIDLNRVYLTGFSKGGSGSYKVVRGFLNKGKLFAGIIRIAGQSQTVLPDEAVENTSIWFHIGTLDLPIRLDVTEEAYENLKHHPQNHSAIETVVQDEIGGVNRETKTLFKSKTEIIKYSVYTGMGHDPKIPYQDPKLFEWLFSQSLLNR